MKNIQKAIIITFLLSLTSGCVSSAYSYRVDPPVPNQNLDIQSASSSRISFWVNQRSPVTNESRYTAQHCDYYGRRASGSYSVLQRVQSRKLIEFSCISTPVRYNYHYNRPNVVIYDDWYGPAWGYDWRYRGWRNNRRRGRIYNQPRGGRVYNSPRNNPRRVTPNRPSRRRNTFGK